MARFDKFDAQRKSAAKTNGHPKAVGDNVPAYSGSSGHASPPTHKKPKQEAEDRGLSDIKLTPCFVEHKQESDDDDDDELSDIKDSPPPKKKKKIDHDSDAAYAARLQAQENSRIRSTRGGGPKAILAKMKKTSTKVKAEDDSDLEGSGSEVKEKKINRTGGFHV